MINTHYEESDGVTDIRTNSTFTFVPSKLDAFKNSGSSKREIEVQCWAAILHIEGVVHKEKRVRKCLTAIEQSVAY